ncbi:RES family NAD+ phosphorylase [Spongiimicrobium sp. 2-473A-2-J]|uniref:RES family NAD+ phosphorylase n=1 Tax=Eudoraea algarum TaxID=3417568 RepID=UPI003D35C032
MDKEIKGFIENNSNTNGDCDHCDTKKASLIDCKELQDHFFPLLDIYEIAEDGVELSKVLDEDWSIFNITAEKITKSLLTSIIDNHEKYQPLIENNVKLVHHTETEDLIQNWEAFKIELKNENRFLIKNPADLELVEEVLPVRSYTKGKIFYRSRISASSEGHLPTNMGKPPHKLAKAGRANPQGIPYLYLAQSTKTTLYEARATFLDYVTIGEFKLQENIKVITLRTSYQVSPFLDDFSVEKYVKNKAFIDLLEAELSKPLRRLDNELDYLPTQYLCEYIKHLGYDGVEYGSSLHEDGINLVIFDETKLKCTSTKVHEISKINIESDVLEPS